MAISAESLASIPWRLERFWASVEKDGTHWRWTGPKNAKGYCKVGPPEDAAYREAYVLFVGPIPKGMEIDHLCRERDCVNPDHLDLVTHKQNMERATGWRRATCVHGHPLTPDNVYSPPRHPRQRRCKTCRRREHQRRR